MAETADIHLSLFLQLPRTWLNFISQPPCGWVRPEIWPMDCGWERVPSHLQDTALPHCPTLRHFLPSLPVRGEDLGDPKASGAQGTYMEGDWALVVTWSQGALASWAGRLGPPRSAAEWR